MREERAAAIARECSSKGLKWDLYSERIIKREIGANKGEIDRFVESDSSGSALRVFTGSRTGFSYFSGGAFDAAEAVREALDNCAVKTQRGEEPAGEKIAATGEKEELWGAKESRELVLTLEKSVNSFGGAVKFAGDCGLTEMIKEVSYHSSAGAKGFFSRRHCALYGAAIASEGNSEEVCEGMKSAPSPDRIDAKELGTGIARKASLLTGAKAAPSGDYDVMLEPQAAADLAALLSKLFSAASVSRGKSLLKFVKQGERLGPDSLEIKDDALLEGGAGSFPFDAEGAPAGNRALVLGGVFQGLLSDREHAEKLGLKTRGSAVRESYKAKPEPGPSNFYFNRGSSCVNDETRKFSGIRVNALMGLHTANPVSGNFSLGINGWLYRNGERLHAVRETLLTGNIKGLLSNIGAVCGDLEFYLNFGSPTIIVKDMKVAGKE